jgi:NAD(P)-dependent dehydrogenase (short-subunit alcohol dehydrogenase family)
MNIIVTGASRGIGFATVKSFAKAGNNKIIAIARSGDKLDNLKNVCRKINPGAEVIPLPVDIGSDETEKVLVRVINEVGNISVLVNNAGKLINKPFKDLCNSDFDDLFNINVKSVYRIIKILLPFFSANAHIINISSMGGVQGSAKFPGLSLYSASKGAVAILTEALAEELMEEGIAVNCLALGAVQTEMLEEAFPGYKAPLTAENMGKYIADFALNGNKYYNGKILPVSVSTP